MKEQLTCVSGERRREESTENYLKAFTETARTARRLLQDKLKMRFCHNTTWCIIRGPQGSPAEVSPARAVPENVHIRDQDYHIKVLRPSEM